MRIRDIFGKITRKNDRLLKELVEIQNEIYEMEKKPISYIAASTYTFHCQSNYYDFCDLLKKLLDRTITPEELLRSVKIDSYFNNKSEELKNKAKIEAINYIAESLTAIVDYLSNKTEYDSKLGKLKQRESEIKRELNIK